MADFKYKNTGTFETHHRAYNSILPCQNKILARKYDTARYDAHRARVQAARTGIDNATPKMHMHLHVNLKKLQTEEERLAVIERDNRMLLEKMSHIMRTQGQVDHRNFYEHKSLNYEKRQKELDRITRENKAILTRIQGRNPHIATADLEADYAQSSIYGSNVTRYPVLGAVGTGEYENEEEFDAEDEGEEAQEAEEGEGTATLNMTQQGESSTDEPEPLAEEDTQESNAPDAEDSNTEGDREVDVE